MAQDFNWVEDRPQQYNTSKTINHILDGLDDKIKIKYAELIEKGFDLDTAAGKMLDVIADRVGASRYVNFPIDLTDQMFGFDNVDWYGFGPDGGTFYHPPLTGGAVLDDEDLRVYIRYKCFANISSGSLADLNSALKRLFPGRGICYASVENDLELTLTFKFPLLPVEENLIQNRYFPVPAGWSLNIIKDY